MPDDNDMPADPPPARRSDNNPHMEIPLETS
jgi:hypothetical protein